MPIPKRNHYTAETLKEAITPLLADLIDYNSLALVRIGKKQYQCVLVRCEVCQRSRYIRLHEVLQSGKPRPTRRCKHCKTKGFLFSGNIPDAFKGYIDLSVQNIAHRSPIVTITCPDCGNVRKVSSAKIVHGTRTTPYCRRCKIIRVNTAKRKTYSTGQGYREVDVRTLAPEVQRFIKPMMKRRNFKITEHRLIAALRMGRILSRDEVVRHLNGIKDDNRPENLIVGTVKDNNSDHDSIRKEVMVLREKERILAEALQQLGVDVATLIQERWLVNKPYNQCEE